MPKYSVIVPVFNRPDEAGELLHSLEIQTFKDFEVIVVEDGSSLTCEEVCKSHSDSLDLKYFVKENSGPGPSRNYGVEKAGGEWVIILDSDVILPEDYFSNVEKELEAYPNCDAFGGPDAAHPDFSPIQKAINYAMTSVFTTGGIRGRKKSFGKFFPRSFNMGIRKSIYDALGGFSPMRFGEDMDFSYRIVEGGYTSMLFSSAVVWHKRRSDLKKFFRQVFNSGIARINLEFRHPKTLKLVHALPAAFTVGCALLLLCSLGLIPAGLWHIPLIPIFLFAFIIFLDSLRVNSSFRIAILSVAASFVQLTGYGSGFLSAFWRRVVRHKPEYSAFNNNFYK